MNYSALIRNILLHKKKFTLPLKGNSMEPTFFEGDNAVVVPAEEIYLGDIILFEINGTIVFHRIVEMFGDWIVTKGDNHTYCDDLIHRSQVLGKYFQDLSMLNMSFLKKGKFDIIFSTHSYFLNETLQDVIFSSSINLSTNTEVDKQCVNIGILPMANLTMNEVLPCIDKDKKIIFHFNIRVSNKAREGFYIFDDFDYVVRLCGHIPNSLLTIDQQVIMALGIIINYIGD